MSFQIFHSTVHVVLGWKHKRCVNREVIVEVRLAQLFFYLCSVVFHSISLFFVGFFFFCERWIFSFLLCHIITFIVCLCEKHFAWNIRNWILTQYNTFVVIFFGHMLKFDCWFNTKQRITGTRSNVAVFVVCSCMSQWADQFKLWNAHCFNVKAQTTRSI